MGARTHCSESRSADRFFTVDDHVGIDAPPQTAERITPKPRSTETTAKRSSTHHSSRASWQRQRLPSAPIAGAPAPGTTHSANGTASIGAPGDHPAKRARLATPEACRRFFPNEARDDTGIAVVAVRVGETGAASAPRLLEELPSHQGFGRAALGCASLLRFEPAESAGGDRVASISVVKLRFTRPAS
jgi:hypothetical protein